MSHLQYLMVMAGCVLVTLPLELVCGARVWRSPRRLVSALAAPVVVFAAWDVAAIAHHQWSYGRRYITGIELPGHLPIEELVFFVVVPTCAILTFEVVSAALAAPPGTSPLARMLAARRAGRSGAAPRGATRPAPGQAVGSNDAAGSDEEAEVPAADGGAG